MTRTRIGCVMLLAVAAVGVTVLTPASVDAQEPEPLVEKVKNAIDRGKRYLIQKQTINGNWEVEVTAGIVYKRGGFSCLAMLALLNCGVKADDPVMVKALEWLRKEQPNDTYVRGLQTMVFAEAGLPEDLPRIQANIEWLLKARVYQGNKLVGWGYGTGHSRADNSNTQYALLGLHAGKLAGAKIDQATWKELQDFYVNSQLADGGWPYLPPMQQRGESTMTMTVAGLCGLFIAGLEQNIGRQKLRPDGTAENCGVYEDNKAIARGLAWLSGIQGEKARFSFDNRLSTFYNIYGIERLGRLSGERFLGGRDWYREGCEYLIRFQHPDGSWYFANRVIDSYPIVATSFSLLFLSKGRTPILISKFAHGQGTDWNNKRYDLKHVVEYASRELFKRQPVAWQVYDARKLDLPTKKARSAEVAELLQSPIVWITGHNPPRLTGTQKEILKQFVEEGGFIFAEACCGSEDFTRGFRTLVAELFPDSTLRPLPPEHPIWRAHTLVPPGEFAQLEGLELGCKTVLVFSPQPICGWLEENLYRDGRGRQAFRLIGNIIAYATGLELPRPRLTPVQLVSDEQPEKVIPRGYLKVAQIRHTGDWQPAPNAMRNLMVHLRKEVHLEVALQTDPILPADNELFRYKFLYMHGRSEFRFTPEELPLLRANLEAGATLFADACCGSAKFDASFRDFVKQLFPDQKLEEIPLVDDLYSAEINGKAIETVRRREKGGAEFQPATPLLYGVKINGRWAVIYSPYDIGCALEKHQSSDCRGHDHASALQLASAALLYTLKR
jgi:hypothetical protein